MIRLILGVSEKKRRPIVCPKKRPRTQLTTAPSVFPKDAIITRPKTSSGINKIDPTRTDSDCAGISVDASTDEPNKEK